MNDQTLERMRRMKFYGMHRAFKTSLESGQLNTLTADELIAFLVESEYDDRSNRRIERHIQQAKFRYKANVEQLHFDIDRNLDKNMMMRFADGSFIDKHENILITGSTGIGKSFVASALGNQASSSSRSLKILLKALKAACRLSCGSGATIPAGITACAAVLSGLQLPLPRARVCPPHPLQPASSMESRLVPRPTLPSTCCGMC